MSASESTWATYSYVTRSKYRRAVITHLGVGHGTPTELADVTGLPLTHLSRAIGRLRGRGLVQLEVPEATRKGRYYGLTAAGREMAVMIAERDHDA